MTKDNEQLPSRDKEQWKHFLVEQLSKVANPEDEEAFYRVLDQYTKEVLGFILIEEPDLTPEEINKLFPPEVASKLIGQTPKDTQS